MGKKFSNVSQALSRLRGWIQAGAALLTNLHLPNFLKGGLYQGAGKTVCVPGLNCYSCPAASGACPIGAFQAVVGSSKFSFSYYITGFLILLAAVLVLSLSACGTKPAENGGGDGEPQTLEEAKTLYDQLVAQENAIQAENTELWEKVFLSADKGMAMMEDGKNYGEFLLSTIEAAKEQFTDEEYELLKEKATEIKNIEDRLAALEEKFPSLSGAPAEDGGTSVPAGSDTTTPPDDGSTAQKFPAFTGKDLDGNDVDSSTLFSGNAVTVVNFWFTTCNPCVGELGELDALNKELAEKGGALIGVNTFTLDGDESAIAEAKDVLAKKGATYQNVYFASDGEAGKFTASIFAYPTTYVVDRSGNIVGDPIVGAVTEKNQAEALQAQIDKALAADMG